MKLMVTIAENPRSWKTVQTNKFNIQMFNLYFRHIIYYFVFLNLGFLIGEQNTCFGWFSKFFPVLTIPYNPGDTVC